MELRASNLTSRASALPLVLACFAGTAAAQGGPSLFSITWRSPTVGVPNCASPLPITEGDVLVPCTPGGLPAFAPLPVPRIVVPGGGGAGSLGLPAYGGCVGHPGGTPCGIEVDALSLGGDYAVPRLATLAGTYAFSVDRCSFGVPSALAPNVVSEAPVADHQADVFEDLGLPPGPLPPGGLVGNSGIIDGNGAVSGSGFVYPGFGLVEPPAIPVVGLDDVDAIDLDANPSTAAPTVYFSVDGQFQEPCLGPNSASNVANGFPAAAVLLSTLTGAPPVIYAPPAALGLNLTAIGGDDLDAIALAENGFPGYQPSAVPYDWIPGPGVFPTDMLLFSVRRGSPVVGLPDSFFGIPIEPGDILTTPLAGGASPFPAIFVAAEWLGLRTTRTHGIAIPDELDALDSRGIPQTALPYCFGDGSGAACPCGNFGAPGHGCANSVNPAGGLLGAIGSASVSADTVELQGSGMSPGGTVLYFQGTTRLIPAPVFGDGLRCVGGAVIRLVVKFNNAAGASIFPDLTIPEPPVSIAGALPAAGGTRHYQAWYRNAPIFCTAATFNLTNGISIVWTP